MSEDTQPNQEAGSTEEAKARSSAKPIRQRRKPAKREKPVDAPAKAAGAPGQGRSSPPKSRGRARHEVKPTVRYLAELKGKRPIVGLTAYDAIMGKLISDAGVDFILVGDSLGTTLLGYDTTIPVTIDDMVRHTSAVRRSDPGCLLVADLPFGEASMSFDRLLESCRRLMQEGGADAVKLEGGRDLADDIEKLVATGIPVLGHIGLLPQTVKAIGGYRKFGSDRMKRKASTQMQSVWKRRGVLPSLPRWSRAKWLPSWPIRLLRPLLALEADRTAMGRFWLPMICLG